MKTAKLERTIKRKLAGLGLAVRPGSSAERGLVGAARLGTRVINTSQRTLRVAEKVIGDSVESARAKIHEASRPRSGDARPVKVGLRRKTATGTRKRTLRPQAD